MVQKQPSFQSAENADTGIEQGLNQMSARSRLLAEADGQVSNPFLLCALVSKRTRQLMIAVNANTSTAQLVNSALSELIAGTLEFAWVKSRRGTLTRAGSEAERSKPRVESPAATLAFAATICSETPCEDAPK